MRRGERENYLIQMIDSAGNILKIMLVNVNPFEGNKCDDVNCVVKKNSNINCRKNNVVY